MGEGVVRKTRTKNHLSTPFEAASFTFEVKAPIFVFRQWHRHRTWSINELSARYRELPEEFYLPDYRQIGIQSHSSEQARVIPEGSNEENEAGKRQYEVECAKQTMQDAFARYKELLACGWPKELARSVLPVATYSHMFASVNLLNLLKFLTLRCHSHAQYEIRVYAAAMRELIRPIVPVCVAAWEDGLPS
jgi:thymidylate synthase (FAD)